MVHFSADTSLRVCVAPKATYIILKNDNVDTWIDLNDYAKLNGLFMEDPDLLVGTADGLLRINLNTKNIKMEIPHKGGINGLKVVEKGNYIVSDWKGKTQLIANSKDPVVLLDTTNKKINAADLEYISDKKLILIPTFFDNRVVAYQLIYCLSFQVSHPKFMTWN